MSTGSNKDVKHLGHLKVGDRVAFNSREFELTDFREDTQANVQITFTAVRNLKRDN